MQKRLKKYVKNFCNTQIPASVIYAFKLFTVVLCVHFVMLLISIFSFHYSTIIDTKNSESSIFGTEPKYFVYNCQRLLNSDTNNIILLGASHVREGFRPEIIQPEFPNTRISNLAVGSTTIRDLAIQINYLYEFLNKKSRNIFIVGLWYGSFPKSILGDYRSNIIYELKRFNLYEVKGVDVIPKFGPSVVEPIFYLLKPILLLQKYFNLEINDTINNFFRTGAQILRFNFDFGNHVKSLTKQEKNARILSDNEKKKLLSQRIKGMGYSTSEIPDDAFSYLNEIVHKINSNNDLMIIVNMPLPAWHKNGSGYHKTFEQKLLKYISVLQNKQTVGYIDMSGLDNEDFFYDSAHLRPREVRQWSIYLAEKAKLFLSTVQLKQ